MSMDKEANCLMQAPPSGGPIFAASCDVAINSMQVQYRKVEALVDSGAAAHVLPPSLLEDYPTEAGSAKKLGINYVTADGNELPDLGERLIPFKTQESHECAIKFQVADVKRPLISVATLMAQGNQISFDKEGGSITTKDGSKSIRFHLQRGVYVLELWVAPF